MVESRKETLDTPNSAGFREDFDSCKRAQERGAYA